MALIGLSQTYKIMWRKILPLLVLIAFRSYGQQYNYFINGFLQQPNAPQARAYLGISNNASGSGTVSNFSMGSFSPLFTSSVTTPTTYPHVTFSPIGQSSHLFFASPTSGAGFPTFRAIDLSDLPPIGGTGTVTNFSSGDLSPLFTTSVANPTTEPALSYTLNAQTAHTVFAGPTAAGPSAPTFRLLAASDIPSLSGTYLPLAGGTMSGTIIGPEVDMAKVQVANLWDNGAGFINLNSPLVINDAGANGSINDRNNNVVIDPLGNITTYGTAEIKTYLMLMDRMAGNTGDNITNVGNIVLNNSSGAGQVLDMAGNPLLNPSSGHVGNGANLTGIVITVTNAGRGASDVTLISSSNTPSISLKALSPGTGTTFTDRGTDIVIAASSSGTVVSITNASLNVNPTRITMVGNSNAPIPSIKSISSGTGVTLADQGTNVEISASGGGGGSGIDLYMTNLTAYANGSNYFIDFAFPSATLTTATNVIAFNWSTNWGLANTSRVCNIFIPQTNYGRIVTFTGLATNWRVQPPIYFIPLGYNARLDATAFGPLDTNVVVSSWIDQSIATTNTTANFNPTNAFPSNGGLGCKTWLDASVKAWQDEFLTSLAYEGLPVRGWTDLSGYATAFTNMITTELNLYYHSPMLGPLNVPCIRVDPGQSGAFAWLQAPAVTAISQPTWVFIMYYGRSGGVVFDSTAGGRIAVNPGQMGQGGSAFCSSGISYTSAKVVNWQLIEFLANGNSSVMRTNGVQAVSGAAGTTSPSQFIVFGDNVKSVQVGTYNVAEILVLNTNLTATQLTNVESYFYRKYPFWNPPTVQ